MAAAEAEEAVAEVARMTDSPFRLMDPSIPSMSDVPTMDIRTFGIQVLGYQQGQSISKQEYAAVKSAYDYYIKKALDSKTEQAKRMPQLVQTNTEDGQRVNLLVQPDGTSQVLKPQLLNTKEGVMSVINQTNAVPIVNPQTGKPVAGYAFEEGYGEAGNGGAVFGEQGPMPTNAPVAVPQAAPAPTPFPEGATIRSKTDGRLYKIINGQPTPVQ
jgi:hypothetical protein